MSFPTTNMGLEQSKTLGQNGWHIEYMTNLGKLDVHDHTVGNGTQVPEDGIALADVTTGDVNDLKHGFAPKLPNDNTKYLNGQGHWTVPPGGGGSGDVVGPANSVDNEVVLFDGTTGKLIRRSAVNISNVSQNFHAHIGGLGAQIPELGLSFSDVSIGDVNTSRHGFVPKPPNDATKFLNGVGQWATPSGGTSGGPVALHYEWGDGVNRLVNGSMKFHIVPFAANIVAARAVMMTDNMDSEIKFFIQRLPFAPGLLGEDDGSGGWTMIKDNVHAYAGNYIHAVLLDLQEWTNRSFAANTVLSVALTNILIPGVTHLAIDIELEKT